MNATLATPANMREYERRNPGRHAVAYSPAMAEEWSGHGGDYWDWPEGAPLLDAIGEPMVLVVKRTTYADALA